MTIHSFYSDKKFGIFVSPFSDGLGDILTAKKISDYFHQDCNIPLENIQFIVEFFSQAELQSKEAKARSLLGMSSSVKIIVDSETLADDCLKIRGEDLNFLIGAPGRVSNLSILHPKLQNGCIPSLVIGEYHDDDDPYPLGLSDEIERMGIFIDHDLYDWSLEERTPRQKLEKLEELPTPLQITILGTSYNKNAVDAFAERASLFYGYTYSLRSTFEFAAAVTIMRYKLQGEERELFFCFPGLFGNEEFTAINLISMHKGSDSSVELLRNEGIHKIVIINIDNSQTVISLNPDAPREKTITLAYLGAIQAASIKTLIQATEAESIGTGDQSTSELFAAKKHFVYEARPHKRNFAIGQIHLASTINPELGNAFRESMKPFSTIDSKERWDYIIPIRAAELFDRGRKDPEIQISWDRYNTIVSEQHRFGPKFKKLIEEQFRLMG